MRITRVQTSQGHAVPSQAILQQYGPYSRDSVSIEAGSKGPIPRHLLPTEMVWNPEIIVGDPEPEMTGTVQNGFAPVVMLRCIDCNMVVASTKTEDHNCDEQQIPTDQQ